MASRPPLGIALHDAIGPMDPAFSTRIDMPAAPQGPAPLSRGQIIAGIIADALSGAMGKPGQFAAMQQQQRQQQQEEAQWSRRRQGQLQDWQAQEDYKRAHPDDQLSQYMDAAGIPADQRPGIYRQKIDAMTAPPMMSASGVDEQGNPVMRFFPRAAMPQPSMPAPTTGTIKNGYRFKGGNPASPDAWELVGGAGPGPRTFP